jgi:hypothetical protein
MYDEAKISSYSCDCFDSDAQNINIYLFRRERIRILWFIGN